MPDSAPSQPKETRKNNRVNLIQNLNKIVEYMNNYSKIEDLSSCTEILQKKYLSADLLFFCEQEEEAVKI